MKQNMLPLLPRVQDIVSQRFKHDENKSLEVVGLVCDLAY